jgi:hypothetical protein
LRESSEAARKKALLEKDAMAEKYMQLVFTPVFFRQINRRP